MSHEDLFNISANLTDADIQARVEAADGPDRLTAYNWATGKAVKKFATKAAGIKQTTKALIAFRDNVVIPAERSKPEEEKAAEAGAGGDEIAERLDKAAKKTGGGAKHDPSRYRSAYVKEQLLAGRTDYETIAEECRARFPNHKTERKHISWDRWRLRKQGYQIA